MASTEEIRVDLAEIVNDVAGVAAEDVQLDKSFVDDLGVDSPLHGGNHLRVRGQVRRLDPRRGLQEPEDRW